MSQMRIEPMRLEQVEEASKNLAHLPLFGAYGLNQVMLQAQWQQAVEQKQCLFVALMRTRIVGLIWFDAQGAFGRGAYLRLLVVDTMVHGQGVGAALLATFEAQCASCRGGLFLLTSAFNDKAQRFYEQHGYNQIGQLPGFVMPGVTELLFWKPCQI